VLNHPLWEHYDITPQHVLKCPGVRFFEVYNGVAENDPFAVRQAECSNEKFWDVVNAFRATEGQPVMYGIGTDDAHEYDAGSCGAFRGMSNAWVMVRAARLTPDLVIAAMCAGDFYASTGVSLDELAFDPAEGCLRVSAKAEPGVTFRIEFITTRRGFDTKVSETNSPSSGSDSVRKIPVYSDEIGRIALTVQGTSGVYRMSVDDLYVRARVMSDKSRGVVHGPSQVFQTAWTQPYTVRR